VGGAGQGGNELHQCGPPSWLQTALLAVLAQLPEPTGNSQPSREPALLEALARGLTVPITLPECLPPLRMLLVLDNLAGHLTPAFVLWLFAHGIMPLYTPLGGSWLNMAESIQRILKRRALDGQHPKTQPRSLPAGGDRRRLESIAHSLHWGGKRQERRRGRASAGTHSAAREPAPNARSNADLPLEAWQYSTQVTH